MGWNMIDKYQVFYGNKNISERTVETFTDYIKAYDFHMLKSKTMYVDAFKMRTLTIMESMV